MKLNTYCTQRCLDYHMCEKYICVSHSYSNSMKQLYMYIPMMSTLHQNSRNLII